MRANIMTMNAAPPNDFFDTLSLQVCMAFQQRRLHKQNIFFVNMFSWFVDHYGKTKAEDCKENWQQMAAD